MVSLARQQGHNQEWAERAVRESVALDAEQAQAQNVVNFVAPDVPALPEIENVATGVVTVAVMV